MSNANDGHWQAVLLLRQQIECNQSKNAILEQTIASISRTSVNNDIPTKVTNCKSAQFFPNLPNTG